MLDRGSDAVWTLAKQSYKQHSMVSFALLVCTLHALHGECTFDPTPYDKKQNRTVDPLSAFRGGSGNKTRSTRDFTCTSLARRPMTVVFGLGTRLCVRMHTTFENGVLHNEQQPASAVNNFIGQGKFGAMKTLSGRIAPHCDKHQFCD